MTIDAKYLSLGDNRRLTREGIKYLSASNEQHGLTHCDWVQPLRLFDEAVNPVHMIDASPLNPLRRGFRTDRSPRKTSSSDCRGSEAAKAGCPILRRISSSSRETRQK
jgi:hypothetical protein